MRVYFTNPLEGMQIIKAIQTIENIKKSEITQSVIYSKEGIFHIINNKLNRLIINDGSSEKTSISNIDFMIDRSSFIYGPDCYQLHPQHISETVSIQTYTLSDELQLVVENNREMYFTINSTTYENYIRTFLSELNLC